MDSQDIFIAYHGTFDGLGSLNKAKELFYFLQSSGVNCYFFPNESNAYFANTPVAVQKSSKFILVCNNNIEINDDGSIKNNGVLQEITSFWNCIYEGTKHRGDARAYIYGGLTPEKANKLHIALQGVAIFDENIYSQDKCFNDVLNWILTDTIIHAENTTPHISTSNKNAIEKNNFDEGISHELKKVFTRRAVMNKSWDLTKMVSVASKIECIGISNNEMTLNMDESVLKNALRNGAYIEMLFLHPRSRFVRFREREEKQHRNTIKNNTEATLSFVKRLKKSNITGTFQNLKIYTYDSLPRINMIFIDDTHLLLQYYANNVPGASNPCFYIKKEANDQLYDFYHKQYEHIKRNGVEIK